MRNLPESFLSKKERFVDQRPSLNLKANTTIFLFTDLVYIMQCNVFYYRQMMHALEDRKREKEINKFQKQLFSYVLRNRCS